MADETVDIGNVGKGGVASEATLESLVKAVEFLAKKEGFDPKKSAEKAKKLAQSFDDSITVVTENREALKEGTEAVENHASALSKAGSMITTGLVAASVGVGNFAKELISGGSQLSDFARHIPGIGSLLTPLTGYLDDSMTAFRELSSVGGAFNNSLTDLRLAAAETYLTLDQFSNLIANRSADLSSFGGTVTGGAKRLADLNRELGDNRLQLMNMGFSFEEINETLIDYQNLNRAGAVAQRRDAKSQAAAAADYAKNLTTLSKLTGKDIDQIKQEQMAKQNDIAFQMEMAKLDEKERDKVNKAMAMASAQFGEAGAQAVKQAVLGMGPLTRETQIMAATMPGVYEGLTDLGRAARDASTSADQFDSQMQKTQVDSMVSALEAAGNMEGVLKAGSAGLDGVSSEMLEMFSAMTKQGVQFLDENGNVNKKLIEEAIAKANAETNAANDLTTGMNQIEGAVREARRVITTAFIKSGVFETIGAGLKTLGDWLGSEEGVAKMEELGKQASELANQFFDWIASFKGMSFGEIVDDIGGQIGDFIGDLFMGPVLDALVAGIGLLFAAKAVTSVVGKAFSGLFGGTAGGGTTTKAPGPSLKPSQTTGGKIGGNIGGALGGIGGGILEGITNALAGAGAKAPLIALGAAAVGGAITLIGAGIAGATWLVGNALPSFAEGMKSFEDLDGARLKSAADGMIAMTGAMAAFGAGSVVSGIGNMVGSVAEGIAGFFGGDSPLDKLKQFADADIDGDAVKQNASSINSFSEAISNLDVLPKKGLLSTVGDALFGNDPEAEKAEFETQTSEIKEKLDKANDWLLSAERSVSNAQNRLQLLENNFAQPGSSVTNDMLMGANVKLDYALENLQERKQRVKELESQLVGIDKQVVNASLSQTPANSTDFANLNELDSDNVNNYREAMENLVTTLENLNGVLSENQGLDLPEGATAATATTGGGEGGNRLNRTMDALLATTTQTSDYLKKIERNTKSIGGDISKGRISDSRG